MLLLVTDTSGKNGSVALALITAGQRDIRIVESVPLAGGTFSAQLIPQISTLLAKHGYTKTDLGAFAAITGPGSFTGLRVGLAAIKALAEVLDKPVTAVSLLEAIASTSRTSGRVLAALDAGRSEVYVGEYEVDRDQAALHANRQSERLLNREEFLAEARGKRVVTSDAALAELAHTAGIACELIEYPDLTMISRLGWERIKRGETVRPEDLEANYIRRSDAEVFSKPKP